MFLIVGLGNPGGQYERNRHNIGFMAVDEIARVHRFGPWRGRFRAEVSEGRLGGEKVLLMKPATFMNKSGDAVAEAARFFKIPLENIIVIHDELDLAPGRVKTKKGGGHAGHNGLRSIQSHLGADYWRVRLGIGHPGDKNLVSGYVLHDFAKVEMEWVTTVCDGVGDAMDLFISQDDKAFMNRLGLFLKPPKAKKSPADKTSSGH